MAIDKIISLIGMPGSGKSTIGTALAARLDLKLVDADGLIEAQEGIYHLWKQHALRRIPPVGRISLPKLAQVRPRALHACACICIHGTTCPLPATCAHPSTSAVRPAPRPALLPTRRSVRRPARRRPALRRPARRRRPGRPPKT